MTLTESVISRYRQNAYWRDLFLARGDKESAAFYEDVCAILEDTLRDAHEYAALASLFNVATN